VHRLTAAALAALALAATAAEAGAPGRTLSAHGVRITVPSVWRRTGRLSDCSDPHQVIALARSRVELPISSASRYNGGLILLLEGRYGFSPRERLSLPAAPRRFEGCCDQPSGPGYEFTFRDHGRDFYAFVYTGNRAVATEAVAILNTLRVNVR
jgi:hypothetical protein